ncbi:hypothetical protein B7982_01260 [Fibrobacter sp. UWB2]|uniref:vWA domain-containing protein n=1 Tax=Fibrobacter sp. UWB2 TaxID=1964358 RepID=UPI000B528CC8|nr:vWA domain-containing protein [Fibrobacter sp. UWB2]OWV24375.1 hypothetical protein B7982_01260 [Fibrobacter sp. UWB2]
MKKKWLAVIAFSLLSAACSDDNIGNFPSAVGAENPASARIESSGIESSADSPDAESSSAFSSSSVMSSSVESSAESSTESSAESSSGTESSSSATPKSSATNFLDTPFGDYEYAITDSYEGGAGAPGGFGGGFSEATTSTKGGGAGGLTGGAGGVSVTGGSPGGAGGVGGTSGAGGLDGTNNRTSGLLTAGEWNDLDNWKFWSSLLNENKYYDKTSYWKFYPKNLVAVQVVDGNNTAIANVPVELLKDGSVLFSTKTDNAGFAYCWQNLFANDNGEIVAEDYSLNVNGASYIEPLKFTLQGDEQVNVNVVVSADAQQAAAKADIAFIVDATGSMTDEIRFLISDLNYIIDHASSGNNIALRTAALFYRDLQDEYITRYDDFSDNVSTTQEFVAKQKAGGGGDYPEAVDYALEASLQKLSWNESARARIAFLILDAPAHHKDNVIESLQKSIALFAQNGIKIIPVAASGVDKDTEFMLRFFELATGGTYVFLTNDSGIGNKHIEASVGDYEVEKLADLMVRLIKKYVE